MVHTGGFNYDMEVDSQASDACTAMNYCIFINTTCSLRLFQTNQTCIQYAVRRARGPAHSQCFMQMTCSTCAHTTAVDWQSVRSVFVLTES